MDNADIDQMIIEFESELKMIQKGSKYKAIDVDIVSKDYKSKNSSISLKFINNLIKTVAFCIAAICFITIILWGINSFMS